MVIGLSPVACIVVSSFCSLGIDALRSDGDLQSEMPDATPDDHWSSFIVRFDDSINPVALRSAFSRLPRHVFRAKGFVRAEDGANLHVERAGREVRLEPWTREVPDDAADTLVVIGPDTLTQADFETVLVSRASARWEQVQADHYHDLS